VVVASSKVDLTTGNQAEHMRTGSLREFVPAIQIEESKGM
jgi:hypothetical protein